MIVIPPAPASFRVIPPAPAPTPPPPPPLKRVLPSLVQSTQAPPKRFRSTQAATAPTRRPVPSNPVGDVPKELGELIERDVELLSHMGWNDFVRKRRGRGDFASLLDLDHPARRLLLQLKQQGAPVE